MKVINDIALVTQVAAFHDKRAFDALVRKYQSRIRRFFMGQLLGDAQLCDDLAQDTFIKAYTHIGSFHGKASFSTWLYRIAYNTLYDYMRSKKVTESIKPEVDVPIQNLSVQEPVRIDVYKAMNGLTGDERTCVTLQLIDGLSIDDISEVTSMPPGTVKSHLSRGKKKLANYLRKNGYDGK